MLMLIQREGVHHQRIADQIHQLTSMTDAVSAGEPHRIINTAVDGFGIVPTRVERLEVGIRLGNRTDVLGSVELPGNIVGIPVESNRESSATEIVR